jgi:crotonobetainyl-CoA:carnitine CoA-transferase CaiB-like acyl-CoA transferase
VLRLDEAVNHPHFQARAMVMRTGDACVQVRSPVRMSGFEPGPPRPAPRPGEHTDEVLRQAGVGEAELAGLRAQGAVG